MTGPEDVLPVTDPDGERIMRGGYNPAAEGPAPERKAWRVGRSQPRNVYLDGVMVAVFVGAEAEASALAAEVVEALNAAGVPSRAPDPAAQFHAPGSLPDVCAVCAAIVARRGPL